MPLVSVIMPAYNAEQFIDRAIHSVLRQSVDDIELVVVDDASTDKTIEIVSGIADNDDRVKLVRSASNQGPAAARNAGIRVANGEFIAFNDADDVWNTRKLEIQLGYLEKNQSIDGVGSRYFEWHRLQ